MPVFFYTKTLFIIILNQPIRQFPLTTQLQFSQTELEASQKH